MEQQQQQQRLRLSPTSIITFKKCPREFFYKYIAKLPVPTTIPMLKGTIVHKTLELFYGDKFNPDFESYIEECFNQAWSANLEELESVGITQENSRTEKLDCLNILNIYITSLRQKIDMLKQLGKVKSDQHAWFTLKPKFKELWLEDKELGLCGYIDHVNTDFDGSLGITDYKTGMMYGFGMKYDYELQCGLYGVLYQRCVGMTPDKVSIIYLRYGYEVTQTLTPILLNQALQAFNEVRSGSVSQNITDYPCKEQKLCAYCNFQDKCNGMEQMNDLIRQTKVTDSFKTKKGETKNEKDIQT